MIKPEALRVVLPCSTLSGFCSVNFSPLSKSELMNEMSHSTCTMIPPRFLHPTKNVVRSPLYIEIVDV